MTLDILRNTYSLAQQWTGKELWGSYDYFFMKPDLSVDRDIEERINNGCIDDLIDANLYATLIHEFIHFFQNITTSYGRFKGKLLRAAGFTIMRSLQFHRHTNPSLELNLPLLKSSFRYKKIGDPDTGVEDRKMEKIDNMYKAIFLFEGEVSNEQEQLIKAVKQPKDHSTPIVTLNGKLGYPLGAQAILEGYARINELHFIKNATDISDKDKEEAFRQRGSIYPYNLTTAIVDKVLNEATKESLFYNLIISYLALNGEFSIPSYEEPLNWEDVHPGWRFIRILEAIENKELQLSFDFSFKNAIGFIEEACEFFKWRKPIDILSEDIIRSADNSESSEEPELKKLYQEMNVLHNDDVMVMIFPVFYLAELERYFPNGLSDPLNSYYKTNPKKMDVLRFIFITSWLGYNLWRENEIFCPFHKCALGEDDQCKTEKCMVYHTLEKIYDIPLSSIISKKIN